jgi:hypothetical protein
MQTSSRIRGPPTVPMPLHGSSLGNDQFLAWLGLVDVHPSAWMSVHSVKAWWNLIDSNMSQSRRPMMSLIMLISWEIWNERNARVLRNTAVPVGVLVARIKDVSKLWCLAGAKYLGNVVPRE